MNTTPCMARVIPAGLFKGLTVLEALDLSEKFMGAVWAQPAGRGYMERELEELASDLDGEAYELLHFS